MQIIRKEILTSQQIDYYLTKGAENHCNKLQD